MPDRLAPAPASLGARLRRLRVARGLTQEEIGRKVGLSKRMVAYYEIQEGTPSAPLLAKLAQALRVSLDDLIDGHAQPAADTPHSATELRLWRKLRRLQELPARERRAMLRVLDSVLASHVRNGERI